MRKGDVHADQWMPYVKPKKKYRPNTFSSLKRRKKPAKNELSQNSLSGGSSLGANIHLIRGKGSESKVKKKKRGKRNHQKIGSRLSSNSSSRASAKRTVPPSRIITNSMSIDDVGNDYIAYRSADASNAFQDKTSFLSLPTQSNTTENGLSFPSASNLSEESSIGFGINSKIGATPSEANLMNFHDKKAFVSYQENVGRDDVDAFNSKLGIKRGHAHDASTVSNSSNSAFSSSINTSTDLSRNFPEGKDPYLLTRPFQGFNIIDVENNGDGPEELSPAIAYLNNMRLGNTFCLWCGAGPMPLWCQGKKCITLSKAKIRVDLPKPVRDLFKRHVGLCKKHNHIFPRGECPGRCPDCGGCNQGDKCTHYNVSGGPKHPSPDGTEEWPPCTMADGSRCFRENYYKIVDPHFNAPIRIQTAPSSKGSREKRKKSKSSIASNSRPSTSSSMNRPSSRGGSSTSLSRPNSSQSGSRPHSKKSNSRPNSSSGKDIEPTPIKFKTKFKPVKNKTKLSNTVSTTRPSSRSSLKRMLNKKKETTLHGHRSAKNLIRPKSSPLVSLMTSKSSEKKNKSIRTSDSSLILMRPGLLSGNSSLSNTSLPGDLGTSRSSPKIVAGRTIQVRPPFKKKHRKQKNVKQKK
eukprot:g7190.t1